MSQTVSASAEVSSSADTIQLRIRNVFASIVISNMNVFVSIVNMNVFYKYLHYKCIDQVSVSVDPSIPTYGLAPKKTYTSQIYSIDINSSDKRIAVNLVVEKSQSLEVFARNIFRNSLTASSSWANGVCWY